MENRVDDIQDVDLKLFENISTALNSLKTSQDKNSQIAELIDQVGQINSALKGVFGLASDSVKTLRDTVNVIKEHQEILGMLAEKVKDLYGLINDLNGDNGSLLSVNRSDISLAGVSEMVDLHSKHLDLLGQHLDMHDKELDSLTELIQLYLR